MSRARVVVLFVACASVVTGVMAWLTAVARELEQAQRQSREQAALEESVRLALWRMESLLAPFVAQEGSRPHYAYAPRLGSTPDRASRAPMAASFAPEASPYVRLHFQWDASGRLCSPLLPPAAWRVRDAEAQRLYRETGERLRALRGIATRPALLAHVKDEWLHSERPWPAVRTAAAPTPSASPTPQPPTQPAQAEQPAQRIVQAEQQQQAMLNTIEWQARASNVSSMRVVPGPVRPSLEPPPVKVGVLQPLWFGSELILVRRVRIGREELAQGCWLDWRATCAWLLASIRDLLPEARLEPARDGDTDQGRRLVALPIRLVPGRPAVEPQAVPSALRLPLIGAWVFAGLALASAGTLLWGLATLSERRAAFVSAVTHELRTPLTTFRMYADMLAEGMVQSEDEKRHYIATLQSEAERQSHLVENVLAYSRLERGRYAAARTELRIGELLADLVPRLAAHARRSDMILVRSTQADCDVASVDVDREAVERILFNLVDNACKYASRAVDRRIHLECHVGGRTVTMLLFDHGPGLSKKERRRLFRPFEKSSRDAANSAPGVGLGLALSRRLARALGGDLRLEQSTEGARFCLQLPAKSA